MGCFTVMLACICSILLCCLLESIDGTILIGIAVIGGLIALTFLMILTNDSSPKSSAITKKPSSILTVKNQNSPIIECGMYKVREIAPEKLEIVSYTGIDESSLVIPEVLNEKQVYSIGANAFRNCMYLEKVMIPASVKEICDGAFCDCRKLKQVVLSDNIIYIGQECFSGTALQTFQFPGQLEKIGRRAFMSTKLREANIPGSVKEIGMSAFHGCQHLTQVMISEGVQKIDAEAFANCEVLREVTIPKSITHIDDDSFAKKYYKDGDIFNLVVKNQNIVMYCHEGSYGLEYARKHRFMYKKAIENIQKVTSVQVSTSWSPE